MDLKIKEELKGQLITRNFIGRGKVVIDTTKHYNQVQLKNLYNGGFSDILEYIIDEVVETKASVETPSDKPQSKRGRKPKNNGK